MKEGHPIQRRPHKDKHLMNHVATKHGSIANRRFFFTGEAAQDAQAKIMGSL